MRYKLSLAYDKIIHSYIGNIFNFVLGILFTLIVAAIGSIIAYLPGFNRVGAMVVAIFIAVFYRNMIGYPENISEGIKFSSRQLLRFAIVLYGFKLNIDVVINKGTMLLVHDLISIIVAIASTMLIAKLIKADNQLSLLLGIGTGVCGAAAIAAVSPILNADDEDTAIGAGIIALVGTLFAIGYTLLQPYLNVTPEQYGVWSGISLHEIAHVAAAAAPAGSETMAVALLAKLGRVFLLIPLSFILSFWTRHKRNAADYQAPFPWFLVGFLTTSLIGTYLAIPGPILADVSQGASFLLAAAMVGLGLNVHLSSLRNRTLRPLVAMLAASMILSVASFYFTLWF